mmetsp:Transcript_204/g.450  ORF Transcript_204/g.450 Transcript_204/m.450 type:complete len:207 (-) Transcript_204:65-685(-)
MRQQPLHLQPVNLLVDISEGCVDGLGIKAEEKGADVGVQRQVQCAALPQCEAQQTTERLVVHLPLWVAEERGGVRPEGLAVVVAPQEALARVEESLTSDDVHPFSEDSAANALLILKAHLELPTEVRCTNARLLAHLLPHSLQMTPRRQRAVGLYEGQRRLGEAAVWRLLRAMVPHQAAREPHALLGHDHTAKQRLQLRLHARLVR